ncbi:phage Gp37/Gp68 family protein [Comamonas terrae]|uniref:Phage Gp37/Gp68 family protein n=1 Tax=Comamonas terrae TaxID=673548 RepID=A0ABW5USP8_9BURK|nr:phage Gp37/Gp68 family protein [Comamonas terrae]
MSENSKIEWTDHTFNPWDGCQKVGPGCDHCYAETRNARYAGGTAINWGPGAPRRRTSAANWRKPLAWNANHEAFFAEHGRRQRVFCASLADVFDNAVDPQWRADLFSLIAKTPNLDWLLLTKRIGNVKSMLAEIALDEEAYWPLSEEMPLPNVWVGATIVNREEMLRDGPKLKTIPARVHFWSCEPLLSDLGEIPRELLPDWVIAGGESGPGARPMHPDWARSLRDQCQAAGVAFHYKQHGEWLPIGKEPGEATRQILAHARPEARCYSWPDGETLVHVGKKAAGRLLDGRTWDEVPTP